MPSGSVASLSPFWAEVRRRHPDVDLVLLPDVRRPAGPAGADPQVEGPPDAEVSAALERVTAYATGAWALVDGSGALLEARPTHGPSEDTVVARARAVATLAQDPIPDLDTILASAGWRTGRPTTGLRRLLGRRGAVELTVSHAPTGVTVLTVTSTPIRVGIERARALVGR